MKYNVHVYTLARVFVPNVEAESMEEAIDWACEKTNFHTLIDSETWPDGSYAEWCEGSDFDSFLVDEAGDIDYERSRAFDSEGKEVTAGGTAPVLVTSVGVVEIRGRQYWFQQNDLEDLVLPMLRQLEELHGFKIKEVLFEDLSNNG